MNDEIYHYGIKGMRWGVVHEYKKDEWEKAPQIISVGERTYIDKDGKKKKVYLNSTYDKDYKGSKYFSEEPFGKKVKYKENPDNVTKIKSSTYYRHPLFNNPKDYKEVGQVQSEISMHRKQSKGYSTAYDNVLEGKKFGSIKSKTVTNFGVVTGHRNGTNLVRNFILVEKSKYQNDDKIKDKSSSEKTLYDMDNLKKVPAERIIGFSNISPKYLEYWNIKRKNVVTEKDPLNKGKQKRYKSKFKSHLDHLDDYSVMYHSSEEKDNDLCHWGIKGRKWGIRNEDERVTSAERMHYITEERKNNKDLLSRDISRHQDKTDNRMNRDTNRTGKKIAKIQAKTIITTAAIAAATLITGMMIHKKSDSILKQSDIFQDDTNSITHWGIKGMRWGVRKKDERVSSAERMYYAKMQQQSNRDRLNAKLKMHDSDNLYKSNRHSDDTLLKQTKVRANYILRGVRIAAASTLAGLQIWQNSSIKKLKLSRDADANELALSRKLGIKTNKEKDAMKKGREEKKEASQKIDQELSKKGIVPPKSSKTPIVNIVNNNNNTVNGVETEKKLKHSGILGMKWGIRRYQNPDGTLTSAGKARYSQKTGKELDARDMSDDELVSATIRLNKERNYNFASGKQSKNPGYKKDIARKVSASVIGTFAASSLASLIYNKFNGKSQLHGKELAKRTLANGAIAAGLSGIIALGNSMGGIVSSSTPIDNTIKNQQQKKEG